MDAPWDTPDALTSVHQLQGLVERGYSVDHDSTGIGAHAKMAHAQIYKCAILVGTFLIFW